MQTPLIPITVWQLFFWVSVIFSGSGFLLWGFRFHLYWLTIAEYLYDHRLHPKLLWGNEVDDDEINQNYSDGGTWIPSDAYLPWYDDFGSTMLIGLGGLLVTSILYLLGMR